MEYQTKALRVICAIIVGAVLGGLYFAVSYAIGKYLQFGTEYFWKYTIENASGVFVLASTVWLAGILVLGCPVWWWLHRKGWRYWWIAAGVGAVAPAVFVFLRSTRYLTGQASGRFSYTQGKTKIWENGILTFDGWLDAAYSAAFFGLLGAIIGFLIWRIAYRKTRVPA